MRSISEYSLTDINTGREDVRFRVTVDWQDEDDVPVVEVRDGDGWMTPSEAIQGGLLLRTIDGSVDCERISGPGLS